MKYTKIFTCKLCFFKTGKFFYLILTNHYSYVHSSGPWYEIECEIDGCYRSYKSVKYLLRHIRAHHALFYNCHLHRVRGKFKVCDDSALDPDISICMQSETGDYSVEVLTDEGNECASSHLKITWTHAIFSRLIPLKKEKLLPSEVIKDFTEHLEDLLTLQRTKTMNKVMIKLKEDGIYPQMLLISLIPRHLQRHHVML